MGRHQITTSVGFCDDRFFDSTSRGEVIQSSFEACEEAKDHRGTESHLELAQVHLLERVLYHLISDHPLTAYYHDPR